MKLDAFLSNKTFLTKNAQIVLATKQDDAKSRQCIRIIAAKHHTGLITTSKVPPRELYQMG